MRTRFRFIVAVVSCVLAAAPAAGCRYKKVMGVSKREHERICAQQVDCSIRTAAGVILTPLEECQIGMLRERCTVNDRCLISCWAGGGTNVGGGCYHWCMTTGAALDDTDISCFWVPPDGWSQCSRFASCLPPECSPFVYSRSELGGYGILLPTTWKLEETRSMNGYSARLKDGNAEARSGSAFEVLRLRDYRSQFTFGSREPEAVAEEWAHTLGTELAYGPDHSLYELSFDVPGEPIHYRIVVGDKPWGCPVEHAAVEIDGRHWFSARWRIPCSDDAKESAEADAYAMISSLSIDAKW